MAKHRTLANRLSHAQDAYLRCHFAGCDLANGFTRRMQWFDRRDRVETWVRKQTPTTEEERVIYDCFERTARPQVSEARPNARAFAHVGYQHQLQEIQVQRGKGYFNCYGVYIPF